MNPDSLKLNLPVDLRPIARPVRITGQQYVEWWMSNLEILAANGQLERMWKDPRRVPIGGPFRWKE